MSEEGKAELNDTPNLDPTAKAEEMMKSGEIPSDPKEIEEMLGMAIGDKTTDSAPKGDGSVEQVNELARQAKKDQEEADVKAAADSAKEAKEKEDDKPEAKAADKPEPSEPDKTDDADTEDADSIVLARDGKSTIPYSVLQHSRSEAKGFKDENTTLKQRLEEAEVGRKVLADRAAGKTVEPIPDAPKELPGVIDDEAMAKLAEDFPEDIVVVLKGLNDGLKAVGTQNTELRNSINQRDAREEQEVDDSITHEIDTNPILSDWANNNPVMWASAQAADTALTKDPDWQGRPIRERFDEVCNRLGHPIKRGDDGVIVTDDKEPEPPPDPKADDTETKPSDTSSLQDRVDKKLADVDASTVPTSHSDLPAGEYADQSDAERAETISTIDLEKKMSGMSSEQIEDYLSRAI